MSTVSTSAGRPPDGDGFDLKSLAGREDCGVAASGVASVSMGSRRIAIAAVLALSAWPVREDLASPSPLIRYEDGRLSVRIERVPLDEVIQAVQRTTGIVFHGKLRDWREVSKRFDGVSVSEALARLIGKQNFVIRYERNGRPSRVDLLGVPRSPAIRRGPTPEQRFLAAFAGHPPVAVTGATAQALGTSTATLLRIAGLLRRPDESVRIGATETLVRTIEGDRGLREALHAVDDGALARVVRQWVGDHAEEFAAIVAVNARDPVLRTKLSAVGGSLGSGTGPSASASRGRALPPPPHFVGAAIPPVAAVATVARP